MNDLLDLYPKLMGDFYRAYHFLTNHRLLNNQQKGLDFQEMQSVTAVKVNPETNKIDPDDSKNTLAQFCVKIRFESVDPSDLTKTTMVTLQSTASSFEVAILMLAKDMRDNHTK
jgi:hypothetical protein